MPHQKPTWKRSELLLPILAFPAIFTISLIARPALSALWVTLLIWLASAAVLFGGWNAIRRIRREPARGIPGTEKYVPAHLQWKIFLVLGAIFFALREGALAPDFVLSFHNYSLDQKLQTDWSSSSSTFSIGGAESTQIAGRTLFCAFPQCSGNDTVCRAFEAALPCTDIGEDIPDDARATASISVTVRGSSTCMLPLVKSGTFRLDGSTGMSARSGTVDLESDERAPMVSASRSMSVTMELRQEMIGPSSCRTFEYEAGLHLAEAYVEAMGEASGAITAQSRKK